MCGPQLGDSLPWLRWIAVLDAASLTVAAGRSCGDADMLYPLRLGETGVA